MEEKSLRLGSVLDDYCPKCRLLLDHAVQAILEGEVQSVVCNTCMHSHAYKHGKMPKKRGAKQSLFEQILAKRSPTHVAQMPTTKKPAGEGEED